MAEYLAVTFDEFGSGSWAKSQGNVEAVLAVTLKFREQHKDIYNIPDDYEFTVHLFDVEGHEHDGGDTISIAPTVIKCLHCNHEFQPHSSHKVIYPPKKEETKNGS